MTCADYYCDRPAVKTWNNWPLCAQCLGEREASKWPVRPMLDKRKGVIVEIIKPLEERYEPV